MEHSGFSISDVKQGITYFRAGNVPVLVRPPTSQTHHISRALDAGADGIMLPMVNSGEEAKHIVNSLKYPPKGKRRVIFLKKK
jgi:2-keto-3-deoxy-L-rhamnonate aldolase RhmA